MSAPEVDREAALSARSAISATIRRAAVDVYGATATETPIPGFQVLTDPGIDDPLAGMRAAQLARNVAEREIEQYADQARGAGRSWDDVAAVLGIDQGRLGESLSPGEAVYALLVHDEPLPSTRSPWDVRDRTARWRCASCNQMVNDRGPYGDHPDDAESGHADSCKRHRADVAAWRKGAGLDGDE